MTDTHDVQIKKIKNRFDGFLPVVIDVETTGVDLNKHGILEIAAVLVNYDENNKLVLGAKELWHIEPFANAVIDPKAMAVNQIDHTHPFRFAKEESVALTELFNFIAEAVKATQCRRAILVGHNAHFDLNFILTAAKRCDIPKVPLHAFTCLDTATLGGLAYGKTVLAKAIRQAGIEFDKKAAHSALYDAEKTAELFCQIVNEADAKKKRAEARSH